MKGWIGRWIMAPFFSGCKSGSGVVVTTTTRPNRQLPSSSPRKEERAKNTITVKTRNSFRPTFQFRNPNISRGIHRLIRSLKNVSPIFGYRDEEEVEMEIGYPTDVKHLTHIGCDGSMITTIDKGESEIESRGRWDQKEAPEPMSLPSITHEQLEMAMAAQVSCTKDTIEVDEFVLPHSSIC